VLISSLSRTTILLMGRRVKYFSLDQKTSAKRTSDLKYIHSPHGNQVRSTYRQTRQRRKQRKGPESSLVNSSLNETSQMPLLPLPTDEMIKLYNEPLPTDSRLFADALRSPDVLDESDLGRWKKEPPFEEDEDTTDPYSDGYLRFTKSLVDVLHGVRLREQREHDAELREEMLGRGRDGVLQRLRKRIFKLLEMWERVQKLLGEGLYHPFHQSREHTMLYHFVQWLGRTICHLYYHKFLD
ncbi:hypothetical protein R3P38DRAFT_2526712, partial [Favolaschia claudopus]